MTEKLYRIEQLFTDGWGLADEPIHCTGMNQETAQQKYDLLVNEGVNPARLRVIREK